MIGMRWNVGRSGRIAWGLLLILLPLSAGGYCGLQIGEAYWRRMQLGAAVREQISFAGQIEDEAIRQRLVSEIRDMRLPPEARRVQLTRTQHPRALHVRISYAETADLLITTKRLPMAVRAERSF
jgi:hypothetical protein